MGAVTNPIIILLTRFFKSFFSAYPRAPFILAYYAAIGAVYKIQWFNDAPLTQMIGSATVTSSEMEVQDLERGKQYRIRIRGEQECLWSEQATRVAGI